MLVMFGIIALGIYAIAAMVFGFVANFVFRHNTPVRRAAYAAAALGMLLTIPAMVAVIDAGNRVVSVISLLVGTAIFAALAFPFALVVTRRGQVNADPGTFD